MRPLLGRGRVNNDVRSRIGEGRRPVYVTAMDVRAGDRLLEVTDPSGILKPRRSWNQPLAIRFTPPGKEVYSKASSDTEVRLNLRGYGLVSLKPYTRVHIVPREELEDE